MKALTTSLYLLILLTLICSCGNDFYIPEQANLLVLQEKKDFKASVSYSHLQFAYSPLQNVGLKASGTFSSNNSASENDPGYRRLFSGTLGLGVYKSKTIKPILTRKNKLSAHPQLCSIGVELYTNASIGKIKSIGRQSFSLIFPSSGNTALRVFEANIFRPHIGTQFYWQSRSFTFNFGYRIGPTYYYNSRGFGSYSEFDLALGKELVEDTPFLLSEFDLQLAKGNNRIQTFMQVSWNAPFSSYLSTSQSSFSFGIKVNIPNLVQSIKKIEKR